MGSQHRAHDPVVAFDAHRAWVEATEPQLASITRDPATVTMLLSRRHFLIQDIGPNPYRLWGSLYAERDFQVTALEALAEGLAIRLRRAQGGTSTVLDTNTLLHYQRPDNIPWTDVLAQKHVRLVVPLRVVEELDAKKYERNRSLAQRARDVLPWLERTILQAGGTLRQHDDEVPVDSPRRTRLDDADLEELDECHELRDFGGQGVTLITGDAALRLRADAAGIMSSQLDDIYLRSKLER
jgi:hypothetical protein